MRYLFKVRNLAGIDGFFGKNVKLNQTTVI